MDTDLVLRHIRAAFAELPPPRRQLLEHLCVYRWFDPDIVEYTAGALGVPADTGLLVRLPMIEARPIARPITHAEEFRLRPLLRKDLIDRLREAPVETFRRAHRLAAAYYHESIDPFDTSKIGCHVAQVHHLAHSNPGGALTRLAAFSHTALLAGHPEAASRAAAEALKAGTDARELDSLAEVVRCVALILAAPSGEVEDSVIVHLDGLLTGSRRPRDPAASRITRLGRDLVTYYGERLAPAPTLSSVVAPPGVRAVARRGMLETPESLSIAEEFAHFPHIVVSRNHVAELAGRHKAVHSIKSQLYAQDTGAPNTRTVIDLFPWDAGNVLDRLDVRDANGGAVTSFKWIQVQASIADAVSFWLSGDDDRDNDREGGRGEVVAVHRELSHSLRSALHNRQFETVGALLERATEATEGDVSDRIHAATRYLPLVAELDTGYGPAQTLQYSYDGGCALQRQGLIGVAAELELILPTEARNQLSVPTPEGVELAGIAISGEVEVVLEPDIGPPGWQNETRQGLPEQFFVRFPQLEGDDGPAFLSSHRVVRSVLHLHYVPRRKDIRRVGRVNLVCLIVCLLAAFLPYFVDQRIWSSVIPVLATFSVLLDSLFQNRRSHPFGVNEEVHSYAIRRLNVIYGINLFAALIATSAAQVNEYAVFLWLSTPALVTCFATSLVLLAFASRRKGLLLEAAADMEALGADRGVDAR
ncbi:hypothetical protein [Streptomyces sp. ISL-86]|uniref:hypothetical protein n=1 Tax=Streptomyces sp. ISL-86 TaxID=2819187 RepID=UPI001BE726F5|nr:hypothetical protein [Streptomyces sp. ISL-86]MBT2458822.1 hypothetical protein [Streptomyces sp. ISL-86]